jgi:hypothetical protein
MQMIDWIKEIISSLIWDGIAGASQNLFEFFIKFINTLIVQPTEPGKYITNFGQYLKGVQYFAGGLLVIFVILAVFRQISGVMYQSERSVGTYFIHVTLAGGLVYVLPKVVTSVLLPLNNALINFIGSVGVDASRIEESLSSSGGWGAVAKESWMFSVMSLILTIALLALCITGAIRYIETLIAILISPLVALSVINSSDGLQIWIRETISIVFTQTIHFLILEILLSIMGGVDNMVLVVVLSIGTVVVGLRGPQIIRQYLYRTGTSSTIVASAGSAGRLGMMAMIFKH